MGVESALIAANVEEARAIGSSRRYPVGDERWQAIDVKGTDFTPFCQLYCIAMEKKWEDTVIDRYPILYQHSEEGPWVSKVPDELVSILAQADVNERARLADAWAKTEELAEWEPPDVDVRVEDVCRFCSVAQRSGKRVLLYISL